MKLIYRFFAFVLLFAFLCSLCSCKWIAAILGNGSNSETGPVEEVFTATYDLNYDGQKIVVSFSPSQGYSPQTPTRPGYQFRYWLQNDTPVDGKIPVGYTGNITLVAAWDIITYRVIYENLTEAEYDSMPKSFTVNDRVEIPDPPARSAERFLGWNAALTTNLVIPEGQTGDYFLHANWASKDMQFTVLSSVDSIEVSASYSDKTLKKGTLIHASAPVYRDDYRFVCWQINGIPVSTTATYSFPLSKSNTELKAVYEQQIVLKWSRLESANLVISNPLSFAPNYLLGEGITANDYILSEGDITITADFLMGMKPGDHSFCIVALSETGDILESRTFTLRLSNDVLIGNQTEKMPEAGESYRTKFISYCGEQLPLTAATTEEFRKLVEYSVLVGGVLQLQTEGKTTGEYALDIYVWGDLNRRLQAGEEILGAATGSVSFPMNPKISISYTKDPEDSKMTITVSYTKGMNATKSSQSTRFMHDRQGLLTSAGRKEGYEAFPIDALTETSLIQTLYELEVLPYGKKPVFAATASEAEQIYKTARGILRKIVDNGMNDYEKVKAIYSWLALNLTYDNETANNPDQMTTSSYTLRGAFVDHLAVCDGYASAFRLLCQIEGIHAEEVIGLKDFTDAVSGHAWNKVWIGGAVFGVDCTWARQAIEENEIVTFSYLFLDEPGLIQSGHYENASSGAFQVKDLANSSLLLPASMALDASNHTFVIRYQTDVLALVTYLKEQDLSAAEFYLADGASSVLSTLEYTVYMSGNYGYLFFND